MPINRINPTAPGDPEHAPRHTIPGITRDTARDMADAHMEHLPPGGIRREGCPECEGRPLTDYPVR